jgi:hypothetical protein
MKMRLLAGIALLTLLAGCVVIYPARIVMPLNTRVVDAESDNPIEGAQVLRIVCDVHDTRCRNGRVDRGETDSTGNIKMSGDRKWGVWAAGPGGIPVPNHQIAIWKEGYYAFVFSQYGQIEHIKEFTERDDIIEAIDAIPADRKEHGALDDPDKMFSGGKIKLQKTGKW